MHHTSIKLFPINDELILGLNDEGMEGDMERCTVRVICTIYIVIKFPNMVMNFHMERSGDEFKIRFVLLVLGALLCPTMKFVLKCSFFHYLEDLTSIKKINRPKKYSSSLYEAYTTLSPRNMIER